MNGNGARTMTKRYGHANELTKTRKRVKKLRREAETRIRKARKQAIKSNDTIALKKIEQLQKEYNRALTPTSKEQHLSRKMKSNVNREIGKQLKLQRLVTHETLNFKKQKRVTSKTYQKIYGEHANAEIHKIGIREAKKRANKFWDEVYKAQDILVSSGFVPVEEVYGRGGSAGSDLVSVASSVVRNKYITRYSKSGKKWVVNLGNGRKSSVSQAIVKHYKKKYGM